MKLATSTPYADLFSLRQLRILQLLAQGFSNQDIGLELDLSAKTVRNQLCTVYASLGVSNRVHAARWALRAGLVSLEPGVNEWDVLRVEPSSGASVLLAARSAI